MARTLKLTGQALALAAVAVLFALLVWKLTQGGETAAEALRAGKTPPAPVFTLDRLDREGKLSLASLRGKAVVINFWASWCEPCEKEAPILERAWRKYRDRGLVLVGVDANDFRSRARRFARRVGMTYPLVHDGRGKLLPRYGVKAFPETFVVDRRGRVVAQLVGAVDSGEERETLEQTIERALNS